MQTSEQIEFPDFPLAVYREIIAHLQQIEGVRADMIPQFARGFDYTKSQISGLLLRFAADITPESRSKVKEVLAHYQERYKIYQERHKS